MDDKDIKAALDEWCQQIAKYHSPEALIAHFREHAQEHFTRHSREEQLSMDVWIVGVLNFANIFQKMFPHITTADMLFKLCRYHINHADVGPAPSFDMNKFMQEYSGPIKQFHKTRVSVKT